MSYAVQIRPEQAKVIIDIDAGIRRLEETKMVAINAALAGLIDDDVTITRIESDGTVWVQDGDD